MADAKAVARARADLDAGRTHVAVQRLHSLLAQDPNNLELRWLLASVHRRTGNLVEAGRWAYLSDDLRPEELAAFSRAQPSPWLRLRMLNWSGPWQALPSDEVRYRLNALLVAAERYGPPPRRAAPAQRPGGRPPARPGRRAVRRAARRRRRRERDAATRSRFPCLYLTIILLVFGALVVIGLVAVVRSLVGFAGG